MAEVAETGPAAAPAAKRPRRLGRLLRWPLGLVVAVALYYAVGGHFAQTLDDDPAFAAAVQAPDGGSSTVAVMAALVAREVDTHGWVANDPVIMPGHLLDDMASYQRALVTAVRAMLDDVLAMSGDGSSPLLTGARDALAVADDRWTFDFAQSWRPQKTTEQSYREAVDLLARFNAERSADGTGLPLTGAQVAATLERFADALGAAADANLAHVRGRGGHWLDGDVDDLFMATKGLLYAQHALLSGLERDAGDVLTSRRDRLRQARGALETGMALGPWLVMNGPADGQFRPSHLTAQAAHVERARAALDALADDVLSRGA